MAKSTSTGGERESGLPRSVGEESFAEEVRKPQVLLEGGMPPFNHFHELPYIEGLWRSATIDLQERHAEVNEGLKFRALTDEGYELAYRDVHKRARYLEIGERTTNGTVATFFHRLQAAQETGARVGQIRESPTYSDHGTPHSRRVKMGAHLLTLVYPELRYEGWENFTALSLFEHFHDMGQIPALLWNQENPGEKIKIKAGHAEEGGVIVDTLSDIIAQQGNMTPEMARYVSGVASVLIFAHDIPEKITHRLNGRVKANWKKGDEHKMLSPEDVLKHYKSFELDLFTTSRAQRIYIMTQMKKEAKVLEKGGRRWGMHPEVETAFWAELTLNEGDTEPLYWEIPDEKREEVIQFAHIGGIADMKDMMTPEHAHIRKFNVDAARERDEYKLDGHSFNRIAGEAGDDTESDYERAMWETRQFLRMNQATPLWQDADTRERVINTVLDAYMNTQDFYEELMLGEEGLARIYASYFDRVRAIGLKALVRTKVDKREVKRLKEDTKAAQGVPELLEYFDNLFRLRKIAGTDNVAMLAAEYERRYSRRVTAIRVESETAIQRLREKPSAQGGVAKQYSKGELDSVRADGIRVFEMICEDIGMNKDDALVRMDEIKEGRAKFLNVGSFDSIGRPVDIKTMIPIPLDVLLLLDQMESD